MRVVWAAPPPPQPHQVYLNQFCDATMTATPSSSPSAVSRSPSPSASVSPSVSPSTSVTPTVSPTPSVTRTVSPTPSVSVSPAGTLTTFTTLWCWFVGALRVVLFSFFGRVYVWASLSFHSRLTCIRAYARVCVAA